MKNKVVFAIPKWADSFYSFYSQLEPLVFGECANWQPRLLGEKDDMLIFEIPPSWSVFSQWKGALEKTGIPYKAKWKIPLRETLKMFKRDDDKKQNAVLLHTFARDFSTSVKEMISGVEFPPEGLLREFTAPISTFASKPAGWDGQSERVLFELTGFLHTPTRDADAIVEDIVSSIEVGRPLLSEGWDSSLFTIISDRVPGKDMHECFSRMIRAGVDPTKENERGNDALKSFLFHTCDCSRPYVEKMVRLLVSSGCDPQRKNEWGNVASEMIGRNDNLKLLLMDVDVDASELADAHFIEGVIAGLAAEKLSKRVPTGDAAKKRNSGL